MIESYDVNEFRGHEIHGLVRIRKNGTVCINYLDERGLRVNSIVNPAKDTRKFGFFVKLPVVSKKKKRQFIEVNLCDLYSTVFSGEELPEPLRAIESSKPEKGALMNEFNQISLL